MANTGNKIYTTLLRVTDDVNEFPLDVNGELCSISGLPQATKPNTEGDPDYIAPIIDYGSCPVPIVNYRIDLAITSDFQVTATSINTANEVQTALPLNVTVYFGWTTASSSGSDALTIISGNSTGSKLIALPDGEMLDTVGKTSVSPTSYGGGSIE